MGSGKQDIRYVSKVGNEGWLTVEIRPKGGATVKQSLPYALKVNVNETKDGRDYFEILEGVHKGKSASVVRKSATESYLVKSISHQNAATVKFNRATQELWYGGKGPYNAFSGAFQQYAQVSVGIHDIQIPDAPHSATRNEYSKHTNYHRTWFRIGLTVASSRYLHVGEISEGVCHRQGIPLRPAELRADRFRRLARFGQEVSRSPRHALSQE